MGLTRVCVWVGGTDSGVWVGVPPQFHRDGLAPALRGWSAGAAGVGFPAGGPVGAAALGEHGPAE
eukprot:657817-Prorocentrum_minimum.AAC.1